MRVKITKSYKNYKIGETVEVSRNEAFGLIYSGYAILSKDMTAQDMRTNDRPVRLRTNKRSRR